MAEQEVGSDYEDSGMEDVVADEISGSRSDDLADESAKGLTDNRPKKKLKRGIYLLPNLFTTASLFFGFYAIVSGMNGHFDNASVAIFVSMILDGLDGRVARMTNTQTEFGSEYDSLSDMVAFGVAPALVAFSLNLQTLGNLGWIATFIYVAGAALRLARFNTQVGSVDKRFFVGLPSPAAAAVVAGFVWTFHDVEASKWLTFMTMLAVSGVGVLMVSNIRYYSFKDIDLKRRVPFTSLLITVLVFVVIAIEPAIVLLMVFLAYTLSGLLPAALRWLRRKA